MEYVNKDVLLIILFKLDIQSIYRFGQTCKKFYFIVNNETIHAKLINRDYPSYKDKNTYTKYQFYKLLYGTDKRVNTYMRDVSESGYIVDLVVLPRTILVNLPIKELYGEISKFIDDELYIDYNTYTLLRRKGDTWDILYFIAFRSDSYSKEIKVTEKDIYNLLFYLLYEDILYIF